MLGITLDDVSNLGPIIEAIKELPIRPTARICLDPGAPLSDYILPLKQLSEVTDIMAQPVDSSEMNKFFVGDYAMRFHDAINLLGPWVDIWEVGNEINGNWLLGDVLSKVRAAFTTVKFPSAVKVKSQKTAVTFYGDNFRNVMKAAMHLSEAMLTELDYALISYYEDDMGVVPSVPWDEAFSQLAALFKRAQIGFGECGYSDPTKTSAEIEYVLRKYYGMAVNSDRFCGGGYYWNFVRDCCNGSPLAHRCIHTINETVKP